MSTYNAFVTLNPDGRLDANSLITVDGVVGGVPVPERCDHGFILFWHRIATALEPLDLQPGPNSVNDHVRRGVAVHFNVVPKAP
jgi:hypothetical protein